MYIKLSECFFLQFKIHEKKYTVYLQTTTNT